MVMKLQGPLKITASLVMLYELHSLPNSYTASSCTVLTMLGPCV